VIDVTATGKGAGPQSEVCRELKTAGFLAIGPLGLMAGGPEDHFTDGRWNWWLPDWAASSSASTRRPCRRRRPRSEAGIRVHLRSAEKGRHSPSQLERPVAQVVPREGRGRSASHPPNRLQGSQQTHPVDIPQEVVGSSRRSPAIPANHRDRTPAHGVIPVYPRPARNYQDRPVTPEVAGSSPVAPVKSLQIASFFARSGAIDRRLSTGHALIPHAHPDAVRSA
jgi:hypothetical protein